MEKENTQMVKYTAKDGIEISLDFQTVKSYLVRGKPDLVTPQEVMFFLGTCKSKGLNPFKGDVHLVKFSQEPAAGITSIDYYRSRAKAMPDCKGWKKGIIVMRSGAVVYSNGLMLKDDELLGGWFEAQPEGWEEPFKLEVNLEGFIKKKADGTITKFWTKEKQPSMIMKVAESQGLRTLWPDEFQGLYEKDEIPDPGEEPPPGQTIVIEPEQTFDDLIKDALTNKQLPKGVDLSYLDQYLDALAKHNKKTVEAVRVEAVSAFDGFMQGFATWCTRMKKSKDEKKKAEEAKKQEENKKKHEAKKAKEAAERKKKAEEAKKKKADPPPEADPPPIGDPEPPAETVTVPPQTGTQTPPQTSMVFCPDVNKDVDSERCEACSLRAGCPTWDDVPF